MRVLNSLRRPMIAIDVGTSTTRACSDRSSIITTPSLVEETHSGSRLLRPAMRGGVVCDVAAAADVIAPVVRQVSRGWLKPAALVCAPSDATQQERDLLVEAVTSAGATVAAVVPEPLAAAIGSGIDVSSEYAQLVVDIGEGVTDVAVVASGQLLRSEASRTGCSAIRQVLIDWLEWHQRLSIDRAEADMLIRSFCCIEGADRFEVTGRDVDAARIYTRSIEREELATLIEPTLEWISGFVGRVFRSLPDGWAAEVIETGVQVTGGGAALDLLVSGIESATGLRALRVAEPELCVVKGAREMLRSGVVPRLRA